MNGLAIRFDRAGARGQVARWKKQMHTAISRAVKASRRAIHLSDSGAAGKTERQALKAKRALVRTANAL